MTEAREMTLAEWCARLDEGHLVNRQLRDLQAEIERQREALKDLVEAIAGTVQINDTQLAGAYRRAKALTQEGE